MAFRTVGQVYNLRTPGSKTFSVFESLKDKTLQYLDAKRFLGLHFGIVRRFCSGRRKFETRIQFMVETNMKFDIRSPHSASHVAAPGPGARFRHRTKTLNPKPLSDVAFGSLQNYRSE